jgi:hypothetical protein
VFFSYKGEIGNAVNATETSKITTEEKKKSHEKSAMDKTFQDTHKTDDQNERPEE